MERIFKTLQRLYQETVATKNFSAAHWVQTLEPVFAANGFRSSRQENRPHRILLLHDAGMGDFVNLSPSLREIRQAFPASEITLVIYTRSRDLAMACPYVDRVIVNERAFDWSDLLALLRWDIQFAEDLLPLHYDLCVNFAHYAGTPLLSYLSGARERIGYESIGDPLRWASDLPYDAVTPFLTRRVPYHLRNIHSICYYLTLVEALVGHPFAIGQPEVWYTPRERKQAEMVLREWTQGAGACADPCWIAVVPGGTNPTHHWPAAFYGELLRRLHDEPGGEMLRFLILGGKEDREEAAVILQALPGGVACDRTGRQSFRASAALLDACACYIGNDTGLMNVAAACGLPVLVPTCLSADRKPDETTTYGAFYPFGVPSVSVQPRHPLPGCQWPLNTNGCRKTQPHCICQITPERMQTGFHVLLDRIRAQETTPAYIT